MRQKAGICMASGIRKSLGDIPFRYREFPFEKNPENFLLIFEYFLQWTTYILYARMGSLR